MDEGLSSEDAQDVSSGKQGKSDVGPGAYDNLEGYMYNTSREDWDELGKSIRMEKWMLNFMKKIRIKENTNVTEIVARAYLAGLYDFRDEHRDSAMDLQELLVDFIDLVNHADITDEKFDKVNEDIQDYKVAGERIGNMELTSPRKYKLKESAVAEVEDTYVRGGFFGGWLHRVIVSLGLLTSKHIDGRVEDRISSYRASMELSVEQARDEVEGLITDYIATSLSKWTVGGVRPFVYELAENVVGRMETENKEKCENLLDLAEDYIEEDD